MEHTTDFADVIRRTLANNRELAFEVAEATVNAQIAAQILDARERASLTQAELAERANTSQSVIARIEDADYDGHSIKLLQRIADAMNLILHVEFYPKPNQLIRDVDSGYVRATAVREIEWPSMQQSEANWSNMTISTRFAVGGTA